MKSSRMKLSIQKLSIEVLFAVPTALFYTISSNFEVTAALIDYSIFYKYFAKSPQRGKISIATEKLVTFSLLLGI